MTISQLETYIHRHEPLQFAPGLIELENQAQNNLDEKKGRGVNKTGVSKIMNGHIKRCTVPKIELS